MIRFIKMLPYPLAPEFGDAFMYLEGVTTQLIDPPSLHPHQLNLEEQIIFHSPLKRVTECLTFNQGQQHISIRELREIPFSLQNLCSREEWLLEQSVIVRRRFKEAFIADQLHMPRSFLLQEIRELITRIQTYQSAAVVSHSFRLKLIEAYLRTHGEIFRKPDLIHEWIIDDKKTYNWGEGFMIELTV